MEWILWLAILGAFALGWYRTGKIDERNIKYWNGQEDKDS